MKKLLSLLVASQLVLSASAQTLNESFESTSRPLTDAEQQQANNYYHGGRAQKILEEECAKLGQKFNAQTGMGCTDESGRPGQVLKGMLGGMIEEILPKLYGIMGTAAMAGGGSKIVFGQPDAQAGATPTTPSPGANPAPQTEAQATTETDKPDKQDYCIYIPMAGEAISLGMQTFANQNAQQATAQASSAADAQKESLYAVARIHDTRAKTATMQGGVYAATSACYVAYIAMGAAVDWKMGLKIGAATLMSGIFFKKAGNHKNYAKGIREVANKLPGSGDCNPFTQTNCFCSEPSSQKSDFANWQKVCIAPELAANSTSTKTGIPCATITSQGTAQLDASCTCKRNNTCLNGTFSAGMGSIGFGGVDIADPLRLLNEMNGQLDDANVTALGAQLNARSRRILDTTDFSGAPAASLDKKKTELAREMNKMGMPARLAALAANSANAPLPASVTGTGGLASIDSAMPASTRRSGVSYNYSGSGGSSSGRRNNEPAAFKNPLAKQQRTNGVQIETFAEQAMAQAEITKDSSVGIFDIISNRYRRSAWSRFEMDKAVEATPTPAEAPAPATP
jgi:hypothetical protein